MDDRIKKIIEDVKSSYTNSSDVKSAELGIEGGGRHNGKEDAFRHAYTSALISYRYGRATSYTFGEAVEIQGDNRTPPQPLRERVMDEHNNSIGREIAAMADNEEEIGVMVRDALNSGLLIEDGSKDTQDPRIRDEIINRMANFFGDSPFNDDIYEKFEPEEIIINKLTMDKLDKELNKLSEEFDFKNIPNKENVDDNTD